MRSFAIGQFWLVRLVRQKMVVGVSYSFPVILSPFISTIPNFIQIGPKTRKLNFQYWSVLAGWAGRSKNGCIHLKLILCCFWAIVSPHIKFHPNPMKNTLFEYFHYWSVLVGRAGWSKNGCSLFKHSESRVPLRYLLMTSGLNLNQIE